jgi:hypothetical protein
VVGASGCQVWVLGGVMGQGGSPVGLLGVGS